MLSLERQWHNHSEKLKLFRFIVVFPLSSPICRFSTNRVAASNVFLDVQKCEMHTGYKNLNVHVCKRDLIVSLRPFNHDGYIFRGFLIRT